MRVTMVEASGSWRAIGRAYGEELHDAIERALGFYVALAEGRRRHSLTFPSPARALRG